MTQYGLFWCSV